MAKRYTVVCPGGGRFDEKQRSRMPRDDKRLHGGMGWETDEFPVKCYKCGDEAQPRGQYEVIDLKVTANV